jgi:hypothetical protein
MKNIWRLAAMGLFLPSLLYGQNFNNGFSFFLPGQDTSRQTFLPYFPAKSIGDHSFVTIDAQGHFALDGQRIRFWGTNSVADGAFPALDQSWYVAGRLRKMGFNLVRLHHLDNNWSDGSLFQQGSNTRHLNTVMLQRMEKYIDELKRNGIYINMNLHVSRTFTAQDGVVEADSIKDYGKGVSFFDPQLLPLYKEYAQQLLTHVNPYTGKALLDDPVMAMLEITNENSLYRLWRDGSLSHFKQGGQLSVRYLKLLDQRWIDFLRSKYGNDESLKAAWAFGSRNSSGTDLVRDPGFETKPVNQNWQLELHGSSHASMGSEVSRPFTELLCARILVSSADGTDWHIQWKQVGASLAKDSLYTLSFAVRSADRATMAASVMRDDSPWTTYGYRQIQVTPDWQVFTLSFRPSEACDRIVRISFSLGQTANTYWFDEVHLMPATVTGLAAGESLSGTVRRLDYSECVAFTPQRVMDISEFYIHLQESFYAEMEKFLKNELGVRVPMVRTNWNVGPADLLVQSAGDYLDNHAYWDHPSFPNEPWSATDWTINNTAMVLEPDGGIMPSLFGGVATVAKPFTVSEYNHPFPNRYQSEGILFLCSYAAFHDVDAVMQFDYGGSAAGWDTDKIDSYFSIHRNSGMMALMPACAYAFRNGLIQPAQQTLPLALSREQILALPRTDTSGWQGVQLFDKRLALEHAVRNATFTAAKPFEPANLPSVQGPPYVSDTGELDWDPRGFFQTVTDRFVSFTGFANRYANRQIGPLKIISADDFASVTWLSLDDQPLSASKYSLFTVSTKTQNSGMIWDGIHTIHNNWGKAPTVMAPVRLTMEWTFQADSITVYPLTSKGADLWEGTGYRSIRPNTFLVTIDLGQDHTLWFGVERFGEMTAVAVEADRPATLMLYPAFPNPSNGSTPVSISFQLATPTEVTLQVFDIQGRRVFECVAGRMDQGRHALEWRAAKMADLANGVYFVRLLLQTNAGPMEKIEKILLLR